MFTAHDAKTMFTTRSLTESANARPKSSVRSTVGIRTITVSRNGNRFPLTSPFYTNTKNGKDWSTVLVSNHLLPKSKKGIFVKIFLIKRVLEDNPKSNFSFDFNQKCIQSVDQWEDDCRSAWAGKPGQHVLYERRFASVNPHADFARLFLA